MIIDSNYSLDLDAIMEWCFDTEERGQSEITNDYAYDAETKGLTLVTKNVHEVKGGGENSRQTMKYDFVKTLIALLADSEEEGLTFGESIIANGLLKKRFLTEVEMED
jgi:hypothetical protein